MSESTEVATTSPSVPALAPTPAVDIGADDIALPKLKIGQHMSEPVQDGLVPFGSLFTTLGQDDPEPVVLSELEGEGVVFHVLAMRKGKSLSIDGDLETWAFNDPNAPAEAWTTYNYVVVLPEVDPEIPYKFLLTKSGKPAAQTINLTLTKNASRGPVHTLAFKVTTAPRKNDKGAFAVPRVSHVEADPENVAIAESLLALVGDQADPVSAPATGDEPAI